MFNTVFQCAGIKAFISKTDEKKERNSLIMKARVITARPLFKRVENYDPVNKTSEKVQNWRDEILSETRKSMLA